MNGAEDFNKTFTKENWNSLFECQKYAGEFYATIGLYYSPLNTRDTFNHGWAMQFPGGRYAIEIFQRHSVYVDGKPQYVNEDFIQKSKGRFYLETLTEPGKETVDLPEYFFRSLPQAQAYAARYSHDGTRIVIVKEWDIIDMY